ncbi:glutathione peroxidase [Terrimonas rubra]|uniref:Glutathione peroxidase n=1 Tax=Terrimonas rubra TaxID=1035890 RepID=A0ABW6A5A0_9BACT
MHVIINQVVRKRLYKLLKRIVVISVILCTTFAVYVFIVTKNNTDMTIRQRIMKAIYPAIMFLTPKKKNMSQHNRDGQVKAPVSFYTLSATANNKTAFDFGQLQGKKVLIVNTASNCGYTAQYAELQKLYEQHKDKLVILGFPANDFKEQEKGTDEEIASFCQVNFGVSFPLMQKTTVIKSAQQNSVYQWLTDAAKNGWNSTAPEWNFSKYLVDENGTLIDYYPPSVSPLSEEIVSQLD